MTKYGLENMLISLNIPEQRAMSFCSQPTDRQTDRRTETDRQTDRQTDRRTETDRQTDRQ